MLTLLPGVKALRHGARVRFHQGTSEVLGNLVLLASYQRQSEFVGIDLSVGQIETGRELVCAPGLDNGKLQLLALDSGALVGERRIAPPRGRTDLERLVDIDAEPRLLGSELVRHRFVPVVR